MATIYRFVIEQKQSKASRDSSGQPRANKGAGKKGSKMPLLSGSKGGVEHNRITRAVNPILNKLTNGVWEKGMRLGRAAKGIVKFDPKTGKAVGVSGPAIAIIIAFVLITVWNAISKWQTHLRQESEKTNAQNFKRLENGGGAVHGAYEISANVWSGKITYNENK